jgi:hypothetical protein
MSFELFVVIIAVLIVICVSSLIAYRFLPKPTKKSKFQTQWKELQQYCAHKETWSTALIRADDLLDMALKRRRYKGTNMGERLVAAQRVFTDNDAVWMAHKLSSKLRTHPKARLQEKDVKLALISVRQGLKDLEVL